MKLPIYLQLELDVVKALLIPSLQKAGVPFEALWEEPAAPLS
jgi:hypothetical protein